MQAHGDHSKATGIVGYGWEMGVHYNAGEGEVTTMPGGWVQGLG